ncbi:MAG: methylated-DNA--[protein]-cysteine S-methyltransferase [Selenomonadaceae bacterium]
MKVEKEKELYQIVTTRFGELTLVATEQAVTQVLFGSIVLKHAHSGTNKVLRQAAKEIEEYMAWERRVFSVPLAYEGTAFQNKVWTSLRDIPYGVTCSYKELAESIGDPKASRAVGNANNKNPLPIFIPCHRVIGSDGSLVGYAGGIEIKQKLLKLERNYTI